MILEEKDLLLPLLFSLIVKMSSAYKPLFLVLLTLSLANSLWAQSAPTIDVSNVRFDRIGNDWIMATVEITPDRNPSPQARDEDFLDDVLLTLNLCYEVDNMANGESGYDFYQSTVRMVSIEQSKRYAIYFFLPGVIQDRDDLDSDPFAWLIEMEVAGQKVPMAEDQADGEIQKTPEGYENFLSQARSSAAANDGILVPSYLAPWYVLNSARLRTTEIPAFYRFEPRN